jgi:hypothetical protein
MLNIIHRAIRPIITRLAILETQYEARLLIARDKARDDGDRLAVMIYAFLNGKADKESLHRVLMLYCKAQGWNGPACHYNKDVITFEDKG